MTKKQIKEKEDILSLCSIDSRKIGCLSDSCKGKLYKWTYFVCGAGRKHDETVKPLELESHLESCVYRISAEKSNPFTELHRLK